MCSTHTFSDDSSGTGVGTGDFGAGGRPVPGFSTTPSALPDTLTPPETRPSLARPSDAMVPSGSESDNSGYNTYTDPNSGVGLLRPNASAPAKLTKFGALWHTVAPLLMRAGEGALVGGFLGRSTPGGGFGAAMQYWQQQRLLQMQRQQFLLNQQKVQSETAKNQAEAGLANRQGAYRNPGNAISGNGPDGKPAFMARNAQGVYEVIPGLTPSPKDAVTGEQFEWDHSDPDHPIGMLVNKANATARPITIIKGVPTTPPGKNNPDGSVASQAASDIRGLSGESASGPSNVAAGGAPPWKGIPFRLPDSDESPSNAAAPMSSPGAISAMAASSGSSGNGKVPRYLTGASASTVPKPVTRTIRNAAGVETDVMVDDNPKSPTFGQTLRKTGVTRQPVPDRTAGRAAKKDAETTAIEDHADAVMQMSGNDPDKALAAINADQKVPSQYKAAIRNRIRELARPGRPARKPSALNLLANPNPATPSGQEAPQ